MQINDGHCHFFSTEFFAALARQRQGPGAVRGTPEGGRDEAFAAHVSEELCAELGWEAPGTAQALAARWVRELDTHGVGRAALIASVPADETSVAAAVAAHPARFVGFFMLDPASADAPARARRAVRDLGLRGICLFPAMHQVPLDDPRVSQVIEVAKETPGTAVFVHCGVLSVGVRKKLGLPSRFDLRRGDPLAVARLALAAPQVPFIIPHFGAGFFREALIAAETCANVHLDTSSSNGWIKYTPGLTLDAVFRTALAVAGATRLLFGTDSSFFPRGWQAGVRQAQQDALTAAGAGNEEQAQVFGGNFERLFPPAL